MQQTHLDNYLRKKYVYFTYVYCNTLPREIPDGVKLDETTEEMGGMYLYRFTCETDEQLTELTAHLEVANITYASRVSDHKGASNKAFNNPGKSFTMQIAWVIFVIAILAIIFSGAPVRMWKELSVVEEVDPKAPPKKSKILEYLTK